MILCIQTKDSLKMNEYTRYSQTATEAQELQKKIKEREKLLIKFLNFTLEILKEAGTETYYHEHDFHTNSNKELVDFYGFSFYGDFGQTEHGGNDIKISYRKKPVLSVYSQDTPFTPKDWRVKIFDNNITWQTMLFTIVEKKKTYIAKAVSLKEKGDKKEQKKQEKEKKNPWADIDILRKKAKALHLTI